jgi:predicted DsbA family dithiol-disulfide isomerase
MTHQLKIDFVSDVACPWCAVGLNGLELALRKTADVIDAKIAFQPFELNPGMPAAGVNHNEHLAKVYGAGPEQLASSQNLLRERAASVGMALNFTDQSRIYNTFDAHRLLHWAGTLNGGAARQRDLKRALFKANFTDNLNICDTDVLVGIAASVGLDADAAREVLTSLRYSAEVRQAEALWQSRGIQAVPAIIINMKWLTSGGQPPEYYEEVLRRIGRELDEAAASRTQGVR